MIDVRPYDSLGGGNHGWLDTKHHFSFADYYDPSRTQWGNLRVWNDDIIAPGTGFPPHPHRDMEIITYVREGAITHRDSMGNTGRTEAGDVQVMSAGTGITHSEYNMEDVPTTLFQIWIIPTRRGEAPGWGARPFPRGDRAGRTGPRDGAARKPAMISRLNGTFSNATSTRTGSVQACPAGSRPHGRPGHNARVRHSG